MKITLAFISIITAIIAGFDVVLYIKDKAEGDKKTIFQKTWLTVSGLMKFFYNKFPFIPYVVGVIFIGHFSDKINVPIKDNVKIGVLSGISGIVLIFSIINYIIYRKQPDRKSKFYPLLIFIGGLIGDLFWDIH